MELKAYQAYKNPALNIRYWRTSTGFEVDFILDDMIAAIEVKGHKEYTVNIPGVSEPFDNFFGRKNILPSNLFGCIGVFTKKSCRDVNFPESSPKILLV